jgi:hypothetical protein
MQRFAAVFPDPSAFGLRMSVPSLGFPVQGVLAIVTAELLQFELLRHGLLVLVRRIVPTLALGALQRDDFSSLARHLCYPALI